MSTARICCGSSAFIDHIVLGEELSLPGITFRVDSKDTLNMINYLKRQKERDKLVRVESWLSQFGARIDPYTFYIGFNFADNYKIIFGNAPNEEKRERVFSGDTPPKLYNILVGRCASSIETAVFAKLYLQGEGLRTRLVLGEAMKRRDEEPKQLAYLIVGNGPDQYVFDPANPLISKKEGQDDKVMPRFHRAPYIGSFLLDGRKIFVEAKNVASGCPRYYGIGDGTQASPDDIIEYSNPSTMLRTAIKQ